MALGLLLLDLTDLLKNNTKSTVYRLADTIFENTMFHNSTNAALLLMTVLGFLLCWIYLPHTKEDGFTRGLSILAAFAITNPGAVVDRQSSTSIEATKSINTSQTNLEQQLLDFFVKTAQAQNDEELTLNITSGEVYISLKGLHQQNLFPDDASLIVRDANDKTIVLYQGIKNDLVIIKNRFLGSYLLEFNIPGYKRCQVSLNITKEQPVSAYSLNLEESNIPLGVQMLFSPKDSELTITGDKRLILKTYKNAAKYFISQYVSQVGSSNSPQYFDDKLKDSEKFSYKAFVMAKQAEKKGFQAIVDKNYQLAFEQLSKAESFFPTLGNNFEIQSVLRKILKDGNVSENEKRELLINIVNTWGTPKEQLEKIKLQIK